MSVVSFCFSIFQIFFGLFFKIVGNSNCNFALDFLHVSLNSLYVCFVILFFFPNLLLLYLYIALAYLHESSYQGARCFDHLLGLLCGFSFIHLITSAFIASLIRNSSTFYDLSSLLCAYVLIMALKAVAKLSCDVCVFHFCADAMYSAALEPSFH